MVKEAEMINSKLVKTIIEQYEQPLNGIHGLTHWARVLENGRRLAQLTGANLAVVELFAVFHDSRRTTDGFDLDHGPHGAEYAASLRGPCFDLSDHDFNLLYDACVGHTNGLTEADITVQTCWDSDRLDLARVSITPDPKFLCTEAAKDSSLLEWAIKRSKESYAPPLIQEEWECEL